MNTRQKEIFIKNQVLDFDFFVTMGSGFVSSGIKIVTGAKKNQDENGFFPTHAGHFRRNEDHVFVIDAQKDGYLQRDLFNWLAEYKYSILCFRKIFTPEEIADLIEIERALLGKEYDLESLLIRHPRKKVLQIAEKVLNKDFDEWKEKDPESELKRIYCSEAESILLQFEDAQLTPFEFMNKLKEEGFEVVFYLP